MESGRYRCKNAKAALYNVKNAKIRVKELLGRGGEIRVSNLTEREGEKIRRRERLRETQRMRVRGGRMFLGEKGETQVFGLPKFWEKISEGKKKERKRKKEKKERKERKERRREEGMMAGDGRRRPELAGEGGQGSKPKSSSGVQV